MANGVLDQAVRQQRVADALVGDADDIQPVAEPEEPPPNPNDQSLSDYLGGGSPAYQAALQTAGQYAGGSIVWTPESVKELPGFQPDYAQRARDLLGFESVEGPQPGAVPSPLPPPSPEVSDNKAAVQAAMQAGWLSMAQPEAQAPPPRAELVKLPPTGPVAMGAREMPAPAISAERVPAPPPPVAVASRELGLAPLAQPVTPIAPPIAPGPTVPGAPQPISPGPTVPSAPVPLAQGPQPRIPTLEARDNPNSQSISDYLPQAPTVPKTVPPVTAPQTEEPALTNPARPGSYTSYQGAAPRPIQGIVLHSSDGNLKSDINTLTGGDPAHRVSAHYYTTADGQTLHFVNDNDIAFHAGQTTGKLGYLNNSNTIGIEQEHVDGTPWSDAQVRGTARNVAALLQRYPNLSINDVVGHSDIAPERKQDPLNFPWDTFRGYVAQYMAGQPAAAAAAQPAAPIAQPSTKLASGFYQNEDPKSFDYGHATTFATPSDISSGQDSGVGAPRLGRLDTTQTAGIAVPADVMIAKFGNNPVAWRKARADVVDPQTGRRLRLPIVDLGPGPETGALFDMTPSVSQYFGGDKNLAVKLVGNAGPDVVKNPQSWLNEQASIKQGVDSSQFAPGVTKVIGQAGYQLGPALTSDQVTKLQQEDAANQTKQIGVLAGLPEANQSPVALFKRLDQPVEGVNDALRKSYQNNLKTQISAEAQKFYGITDPQEAFKKATSDADFGTVASELSRNIMGNLTNIDVMFGRASQGTDDNRINQFAQLIHPEATPEGRAAFLKTLMALPQEQRPPTILKLLENVDPEVRKTIDPMAIADSVDRMADPAYQKSVNDAISAKRAEVQKDLESDPRLKGTTMDKIIQIVGPIPAQTLLALPSIAGGPAGHILTNSLFAAQIHSDTLDQIKAEHPDWSEAQVKEMADKSTAFQMAPQIVLTAIHSGQLGDLISGLTQGGLTKRIVGNAIVGLGGGATAAGAQQIAANYAEGKPLMQGVPEASIAGAVQALPGAAIGVTHGAPAPQPEIVPRGIIAEQRAPAPPTVTAQGVLGPERGEVTPWYRPQEPIVTRQEPGIWTPEALAQAIRELPANATPEQIARRVEQLEPPPSQGLRGVYFAPSENLVTQEDVARRAYEISGERTLSGTPGNGASDWNRAQAELASGAVSREPVTQGEAEPWVSGIANRYTAERAARGELGAIAPGEGVSTDALMARGLKMGPEQINQHVSDLMSGKGGDPITQASAVRAEEARLSQRSNAASHAFEANPTGTNRTAMNDAFNDLTDFHNGPVAKIKSIFHGTGMGLQGELPVDLSTLNGLREAFFRNQGAAPPVEMEPVMRKTAKAVSDATAAENEAMRQLGAQIDQQTRGKTLSTDDQIRTRLMELMKDLPCPT